MSFSVYSLKHVSGPSAVVVRISAPQPYTLVRFPQVIPKTKNSINIKNSTKTSSRKASGILKVLRYSSKSLFESECVAVDIVLNLHF